MPAASKRRGAKAGAMILGLGSDLIDIRRIGRVIDQYGDRFLDRILTTAERARCERRTNRAASYARRFAAKEACSKALGTGFRRGVFWRDLGVVNLVSGQPTMRLTGGALRRLDERLERLATVAESTPELVRGAEEEVRQSLR